VNFEMLGHQHFEFSVVKELAEPSKKLAEECGSKPASDELLFDFNDELNTIKKEGKSASNAENGDGDASKSILQAESGSDEDLLNLANASEYLETLLGPMDQSPETEKAQDALDLGLGLDLDQNQSEKDKDSSSSSNSRIGSFMSKSMYSNG
jgi:hypothetical protein